LHETPPAFYLWSQSQSGGEFMVVAPCCCSNSCATRRFVRSPASANGSLAGNTTSKAPGAGKTQS